MTDFVTYEIAKQRHTDLIAEAQRGSRAHRAQVARRPRRQGAGSAMRGNVAAVLLRLAERIKPATR
jgi:hypothetical protein